MEALQALSGVFCVINLIRAYAWTEATVPEANKPRLKRSLRRLEATRAAHAAHGTLHLPHHAFDAATAEL